LAKLEKDNKELHSELARQKQVVALDTQGKCGVAAKTFFKEGFRRDKDTITLDYSNHYNASLGKCFIEITWNYRDPLQKGGAYFRVMYVYDVYEHRRYAEFTDHTEQLRGKWETSVVTCAVTRKECHNRGEFENSIRQYMYE
jgi:hypothetical protein